MPESVPKRRIPAYVNPARQNDLAVKRSSVRRGAQIRPHTTPTKTGDELLSRWLVKAGRSSWYLVGIALMVVGVFFITSKIGPVFIAVFIALVFTALLNPVVNFLARYLPRWLGVVIAIVGSFAFFTGLIAFVVTSVAGQWTHLGEQLADGVEKILDLLDKTPFHITLTTDEVYKWFVDLIAEWEQYLSENWQSIASTVLSNAGAAGVIGTILVLSIFVSIFFLHSGKSMWRWFIDMLPSRVRESTNRAANAGWNSFAGYARGTVMVSVSDGLLAWVLLAILQVPLAPALAVLVMIGAVIPMVGAPAAMVVAMIVALATDGIVKAIIVGLGIALIGQFEGHVLQPLIMSRQVSLHPVVVGVGVVVGAFTGGLLGAIVVIPIMGVCWAVFSALYKKDPPVTGELPGTIPVPEREPPTSIVGRFLHPIWWVTSRGTRKENAGDETESSEAEPSKNRNSKIESNKTGRSEAESSKTESSETGSDS